MNPLPGSSLSSLISRLSSASPMGFEPTISTVTGWRALRCSTRTGFAGLCLRQVSNDVPSGPRL